MILNISDSEFKRIFTDEQFHLPIRWDNRDFAETLRRLFLAYESKIKELRLGYERGEIPVDAKRIRRVNNLLVRAVEQYLDGFPETAFRTFGRLMMVLEERPLKTYDKSVREQFEEYKDPLNLYRVTRVTDNIPYGRDRVFHTPYYLRSKVSTSRYSIAGFPSLYLGTSLELCCEEVQINPHEHFTIASRFQLNRDFERHNIEINVIELGIKPQDFLSIDRENNYLRNRTVSRDVLKKLDIYGAYLLWYPLIAACSFIRVNKKDPFAPEYIIPQLLMQWVRIKMRTSKEEHDRLVGIRYFSCASVRASDMGFNYVFPSSGQQTTASFCPVLSKAFKLTKPCFLHEYRDIYLCEEALRKNNDLRFV